MLENNLRKRNIKTFFQCLKIYILWFFAIEFSNFIISRKCSLQFSRTKMNEWMNEWIINESLKH